MFGRMASHDAGGVDGFAAAKEVEVEESVDGRAVGAEVGDESLGGHDDGDAMVLNDDAGELGLRGGVKFAGPDAIGDKAGKSERDEQEQSGGP